MPDLSIIAASVLPSNAASEKRFTAGVNISAGQVLYQAADRTVKLADGDGAAPSNVVLGIAGNSAAAGQPVSVVLADPALYLTDSIAPGALYQLSNTPGGIEASTGDLSGKTVLGIGLAAGKLSLFQEKIGGGAPAWTSAPYVLNVGDTAGTVTSGDDVGVATGRAYGIAVTGAITTGLTDVTARLQAAHDALPAGGGRIVAPQGKFKLTGLNISKKVIWVGAGASGDGESGTCFTTDDPAADMFNVTADGCVFEDITFRSTATTPTAGALLHMVNSNHARVNRCIFYGGFHSIQVDNGQVWMLTNSFLYAPRSHGLVVADVALPDGGDQRVTNVIISAGTSTLANSAAIYQTSGGGLTLTSVKVNGPSNGVNGFACGMWMNSASDSNTSILIVNGCSIENVSSAGVKVSFASNTGSFGKVVITNNEFGYIPGAAAVIGDYTGDLNAKVTGVLIDNNMVTNTSTGFSLKAVSGGRIGSGNWYDSTVAHCVVVDGDADGVEIAPQSRQGDGFLVENASELCPTRYLHVGAPSVYAANQVLYRCAVPTYHGGTIKVTTTGIVQGVGTFTQTTSKAFTRDAGAVTLAALGPEIATGVSAAHAPLTLDVSSVSGEVQVQQTADASAFFSNITVEVCGQLTSFKVGA